jgi:hypothetical protein
MAVPTTAQLVMLIEGIDWRAPERFWRRLLADNSQNTAPTKTTLLLRISVFE